MSRAKILVPIGALLLGLAARGALVPGAGIEEDEYFVPPARIVEETSTTPAWEPSPDVRDPFVPLVLPAKPEASSSLAEESDEPEPE